MRAAEGASSFDDIETRRSAPEWRLSSMSQNLHLEFFYKSWFLKDELDLDNVVSY